MVALGGVIWGVAAVALVVNLFIVTTYDQLSSAASQLSVEVEPPAKIFSIHGVLYGLPYGGGQVNTADVWALNLIINPAARPLMMGVCVDGPACTQESMPEVAREGKRRDGGSPGPIVYLFIYLSIYLSIWLSS